MNQEEDELSCGLTGGGGEISKGTDNRKAVSLEENVS